MSQAAGAGAGAAAAAATSAVNNNVRSGGKRKAETPAVCADDGKSRKLTQDGDAKVRMCDAAKMEEFAIQKLIREMAFCGDGDLIPDTPEGLRRQLNALSKRPLLDESLEAIDSSHLGVSQENEEYSGVFDDAEWQSRVLSRMMRFRGVESFPFIQDLKFPETTKPKSGAMMMKLTLLGLLGFVREVGTKKEGVNYFLVVELSLLLRLFVALGGDINAVDGLPGDPKWAMLPDFMGIRHLPMAVFIAGRRLKVDWETRTRPPFIGMIHLSFATMMFMGLSPMRDGICGVDELAKRAAVIVGDAGLLFTPPSRGMTFRGMDYPICLWRHLSATPESDGGTEWLFQSLETPASKLLLATKPGDDEKLALTVQRVNVRRITYARLIDEHAEGVKLFAKGPWGIIAKYAVSKEARDCAAAAARVAAVASAAAAARVAAAAAASGSGSGSGSAAASL